MQKRILNNKGQSLVEYLIIVAIVAVGTIGIVRVVGQNISANFAKVSNALSNTNSTVNLDKAEKKHYSKKDLGNFMEGATSTSEKSGGL